MTHLHQIQELRLGRGAKPATGGTQEGPAAPAALQAGLGASPGGHRLRVVRSPSRHRLRSWGWGGGGGSTGEDDVSPSKEEFTGPRGVSVEGLKAPTNHLQGSGPAFSPGSSGPVSSPPAMEQPCGQPTLLRGGSQAPATPLASAAASEQTSLLRRDQWPPLLSRRRTPLGCWRPGEREGRTAALPMPPGFRWRLTQIKRNSFVLQFRNHETEKHTRKCQRCTGTSLHVTCQNPKALPQSTRHRTDG